MWKCHTTRKILTEETHPSTATTYSHECSKNDRVLLQKPIVRSVWRFLIKLMNILRHFPSSVWANSLLSSEEIPRLLCNPKVHYRFQKCILSQMDTVLTITSCFLKIHCNIILWSTPTSFKRSLPFRFLDQSYVYRYSFVLSPMCTTCPACLILLDLIILIIFREK
jgi:hypothetical protein